MAPRRYIHIFERERIVCFNNRMNCHCYSYCIFIILLGGMVGYVAGAFKP